MFLDITIRILLLEISSLKNSGFFPYPDYHLICPKPADSSIPGKNVMIINT